MEGTIIMIKQLETKGDPDSMLVTKDTFEYTKPLSEGASVVKETITNSYPETKQINIYRVQLRAILDKLGMFGTDDFRQLESFFKEIK